MGTVIELEVLRAVVRQTGGARDQALEALGHAVELAEPTAGSGSSSTRPR